MGSLKRVLFISGTRGAGTLRYRVRLAEEALRARGVRTSSCYFTDPHASTLLPDADVLALYRVPATGWLHELVRRAHKRGIPITYDIDDLVFRPEHLQDLDFLPALSEAERAGFFDSVPKRAAAAGWAASGSATTAAIADELADFVHGPVEVIPNGVGRVALQLADHALGEPSAVESVVLGYFSGSNTHDADWLSIEHDVAAAMQQFPQAKLLLVGPVAASSNLDEFESRVRRIDFVDWRKLFGLLTSVDINLAPLTASRFTNGKSAIKWLEAALVETPTIATATDPNMAAVNSGVDGVLVPIGDSWLSPLTNLITNPDQRHDLGAAARASALREFGPTMQSQRYGDFFQAALDRGPSPAVLPREPYRIPKSGKPLEDYDFPTDLENTELAVSATARLWLAAEQARQLPSRVGRAIRRRL